jgi:hypothetical protein
VVSRHALNARAGIRGLLLTTSSPHLPALPQHGPEARVRHPSEHREPLLIFTLGPRRILDRPVQPLLCTGEDRLDGYDLLERVTQLAFQRLRLLAEDVRPEFRHDGDRLRLPRVAVAHALYASKRSSARCLNNPSAICERAQFWVHRDRTLVLATFLGLALECPANQPVFYRCMYQVQCCAGTELCSAPPLTLAHWRAGRPQRAMKPAAAASSKVLLGS